MNRKWIFILLLLASICHGQTFRRNYEFPDIGSSIQSLPPGAIPDDSITIAMMADGDHGAFTYSSNVASLDIDVVSVAQLADGDYGDWSVSSSLASLDDDVVGPDELADGDYGDVSMSSGSITIDAGAVALSDLVSGVTAGDMLYWTGSAWAADIAPVVGNGGGPSLGAGKGRIKFTDDTIDVVAIRTATLRIQFQEDDTAIVNAMNLGILDFYGDDDTASADEVAGQIQVTATGTWTDGAEDGRMELSVADDGTLNNDQLVLATDGSVTTSGLFSPTDLEIPQATPAVPGTDGGVEVDFTDGTLVVQHGSAHAELGASTDVVMGKLIKSWSATLAMPDDLQGEKDYWLLKAITSTEFPHGVVITSISLYVSENTSYTINVENWDDWDTINGANGTIDSVAYTADTTGEVTETAITYATIAAGQLIMVDLPTTDVGHITIQIEYYEPAA